MPAGMHLARIDAGIIEASCLLDRQRVHIRANANHPLAGAGRQAAHDASAANARLDLKSPVAQVGCDKRASLMLGIGEFGPCVEEAAEGKKVLRRFGPYG